MARIRAIPIIPMLPANEVRKVLAFFVRRLLKERESAVAKDIEVPFFLSFFLPFLVSFFSARVSEASSSSPTGAVSLTICPSRRRTILVA